MTDSADGQLADRGREIERAEPDVHPVVHVIAPIIAIGATMVVRKIMNSGYRRVTGSPAPDIHEPGVSMGRALVWAVATAAAAAAVEVAVYRITSGPGRRG